MRAAAPAAAAGAPPGPPAGDLLEQAETVPRDKAKAVAEYRKAFYEKLEDGVYDEQDRRAMAQTRDRERLSAEEAAAIEQKALSPAADEADACDDEGRPPAVTLEINDNHFYMTGMAAVLDFRFVNRTDRPLSNVCLTVSGQLIGAARQCTVRLPARRNARQYVQLVLGAPGEMAVDLSLTYELDGEPFCWTVQALLMVLARPDNLQSLVVQIDQSVRSEGGGKIFGSSINQEAKQIISEGLVKDVNQIMQRSFRDHWTSLPLMFDEDETRRRRESSVRPVKVVSALAHRRAPMDRAAIISSDEPDAPRVCLLGIPQVRLGRSRSNTDISLVVLPRSPENDKLSFMISGHKGPHCVLSLRPEGLFLADQDTMNGTELNGHAVRGEAKVPLDRASDVDVAKALRLRLIPFLETDDQVEVDPKRHGDLGLPDDLWQTAARLKLRSLMIRRVDNLAEHEKYLVVYRWANVGRGAGSEILIPDPTAGLRRAHVRIIRLGGQFWLESLVQDKGVTADGINVPRGQACPLALGMKVTFGNMAGTVSEFQQIGR
jgi:hypothetical protein